jgi:hypothetical protein
MLIMKKKFLRSRSEAPVQTCLRWFLPLLAMSAFCVSSAKAFADDSATSRITAFSARATAGGTGDQSMILGIATAGGNGKSYAFQALGPMLKTYGVSGTLADPKLSLFSNGKLIASNDNWTADSAAPASGITPLPQGSLDAALLQTLDQGCFTATISGAPSTTGVAMGQIYSAVPSSSARLSAISVRAPSGSGDATLITGFVIDGTAKKTVLVRAIGPSLAKLGISGALDNPKLELYEGGSGSPFVVNDDWAGSSPVATAASQMGLLPFPATSKDAALLVTLSPGVYTARVSSADSGNGLAMFELYENPVSVFPRTSANNAIYKHGDTISFAASGGYTHSDGSKTLITGGWLRLEILDERESNPLNNNLSVMSLVETQLYVGAIVSASGVSTPVRIVGMPTTRYYVQDTNGTILYQGEKVPEGAKPDGSPIYKTYWFSSPKNYVQYQAPFVVGTNKVTPYTKLGVDGSTQKLGNTVTDIEAIEPVTTSLGTFDTYRIRLLETSRDAGNEGTPLWYRTQNVYPDIGIVRFDFFSVTPGDTGAIVMSLSDTNLPYLGGDRFALAKGNRLIPVVPGQVTRFNRSGYYVGNDGTVEEISGWFTMEARDEGVINPTTKLPCYTLIETHYTDIEATTLAGVVTHTKTLQSFKRYCRVLETGATAFVGDTGPTGDPVWFDAPFVPLEFPYYIGETKTATITASLWTNGAAVPLYSYTPMMQVTSLADVRTTLGTFECYRMSYQDSNGYLAEQYTYPAVGVTKFSYPAPAGKSGHMDLTITSTNVQFR